MGNREHRRANKHAREKTALATVKREEELWNSTWRYPVYEKLEKPTFWGYTREFVLREDVAQRNDASKWRALLVFLQNTEYSKRKDFKYRQRPSRKWKERPHRLKTFSTWDFERKIPNKFKIHFRFYYVGGRRRYYFIHPWMMVTRRKKEYNTHRKLLNPEIQKELGYLENRIENQLLRATYCKIKGGGYNYRHWNQPRKEKLQNMHHRNEINEGLLLHQEGEIKPIEIE